MLCLTFSSIAFGLWVSALAALLASPGAGLGISLFKAPLGVAGVQPGEEPVLRGAYLRTRCFDRPRLSARVSAVVSQSVLTNQRKK